MTNRLYKVVALLTLAAVSSLALGQTAHSYSFDYRDNTMYFSGEKVYFKSGFEQTSAGAYVGPLYSGEAFLDGTKESNAYQSAGNVMPNKAGQFALPNDSSDSGGYGGAIGFRALNLANVGGAAKRNDPDRKQKLFNFLQTKYNSGTSWERMGAALIAQQMVQKQPKGGPWGESARTFTDWTDLQNRLVSNDNVSMTYVSNYHVVGVQNTNGVQYKAGGSNKMDVIDNVLNKTSATESNVQAAWVFRDASKGNAIVYVLEVNCANPIGGFGGFDVPEDPIKYSLTPSILDITNKEDDTTISSNGFVNRGADVVIKNRVRNDGPDASAATTRVITRIAYKSDASPSTTAADATSPCSAFSDVGRVDNGALGCSGIKTIPEAILGAESNSDRNTQDEYKIDSRYEVDTKVCFVVSIRKPTQDASNDTWRHSAMRCVVVAREYVLIPTIDGLKFFGNRGDGAVVEPGMSGTIEHSVDNTGKDDTKGVEWRLTYYEYGPKRSSLTATEKAAKKDVDEIRDPCSAFPGGVDRLDCTHDPINGWRDESKIFAPGPTSGPALSYTVPDDKVVGTKMCWVASVRPPTASSPTTVWRHSAMYCIIVGKKPKMQVWGGDVRVGGRINTSTSTVSSLNSTFGSWSEYGALSRGVNVGFSSGAGLAGGGSPAGQAEWSDLTFANVTGGRPAGATCTLRFGCFTHLPLVGASLVGQFDFNRKPPISSTDVNSLNGIYNATNVNLVGTTVQPTGDGSAKYVVINATGTVTISGNITYSDGPYTSTRQIPQVIIRAPRINIQGNVTNVDAWLFAGVLNTCSRDGSTVINPAATGFTLSSNQCNQSLRVNGPVVADKVYLMRTAGSEARDGQRGDPGEIFNLRADAYLWGYGYGSGQSRIQTVHTKELAPRF